MVQAQRMVKAPFLALLNGRWHERALWLFMIIVYGHWMEHLAQLYQVFVLGWARPASGGVLGLLFPWLAQSEILHFVYNLSLLAGIALLQPGFSGRSRRWWNVALAIQGWHFFEHFLLQVQWLTGHYLFGRPVQTSILQLWFPRIELHFVYNLLVFIPLMVGLFYHFYQPPGEPVNENCPCSRWQRLPYRAPGVTPPAR